MNFPIKHHTEQARQYGAMLKKLLSFVCDNRNDQLKTLSVKNHQIRIDLFTGRRDITEAKHYKIKQAILQHKNCTLDIEKRFSDFFNL